MDEVDRFQDLQNIQNCLDPTIPSVRACHTMVFGPSGHVALCTSQRIYRIDHYSFRIRLEFQQDERSRKILPHKAFR